jgi:disulfide bond formation protein DsbB
MATTFAPPARGGPGAMASATAMLAFVAIVSLGSIVAALVSQHAFGMEPCPWCILQRLIFAVIGVLAMIGLAIRATTSTRIVASLGVLLSLAGLGAALWQHLVAAKSASCNLTLADRIVGWTQLDQLAPNVFEARASCADAAVNLLGVPYAIWSAAAFVICAVALLRALKLA